MTTRVIICENCARLWANQRAEVREEEWGRCDAFPGPDGIPDEIREGGSHLEPVAGDDGLTFEPVADGDREWAEAVWGSAFDGRESRK